MNTQQPVTGSKIQGLIQITLPTFGDDRGFFREVCRIGEIEQSTGIPFQTKQLNHAKSTKYTLRGIHIAEWNKIIYVTRGEVQSVIVDSRQGSATFGQHDSFLLGEKSKSAIFVPAYCGNAYLVLSTDADYIYLTDQVWYPNSEKGIAWNDPELKINWMLDGSEPVLSEKDRHNPPFSSIS